jgi:hypothetical protein
MTRKTALYNIIACTAIILAACGCKDTNKPADTPQEDLKAKSMLEGIWIDADEETVVFKIKGDTVYYPDSTSQPVKFQIIQDTMILLGNNASKYPIVRQEAHIFEFKNQSNDIIKLVKSENPYDSLQFVRRSPVTLNQGKTIKADTIVIYGENKYHSYVQVNPTTYKVYRSFYNAEGMEVENIYYDNIIHVSIFKGANRIFSKDFRKADFNKAVPDNMLKQCVLSNIKLTTVGKDGFHYQTQLAIPDSPSSFIVELIISYDGKTDVRLFK